jgi:hypothetical protein
MKFHSYYKCAGQTITRLYESWSKDPLEVEIEVPGEGKMDQFDLGDWWVMSPYGDDRLPKKLRRRIFGNGKRWALALNRKDGRVATAHYFTEDERHCFFIEQYQNYRLPPEYVSRIDDLRELKRPYSIHLHPDHLADFIDGEIGYAALREGGVIVKINFNHYLSLELNGDFYRVCPRWADLTLLEREAKVTDEGPYPPGTRGEGHRRGSSPGGCLPRRGTWGRR